MDDPVRQIEGLRELVPAEPPPDALAAARSEAEGVRSRRRRAVRRRAMGAAGIALALASLSFTPPGRAATEWIAALASVGEEPTASQPGSVEGSAVVVATGRLPDGSPYEVVADRMSSDSIAGWLERRHRRDAGAATTVLGSIGERICLSIDFPREDPGGGGANLAGACTEVDAGVADSGSQTERAIASHGVWSPSAPMSGTVMGPTAKPEPRVFLGLAPDAPVADVRTVQADGRGGERELPSRVLAVDGQLLDKLGGDQPVRFFLAELDETAMAAAYHRRAQVTSIAYDSEGQELDRVEAFPLLECGIPSSPRGERSPALDRAVPLRGCLRGR